MKFKYKITGIDCPNCAAKLASQIEHCKGVLSAKINFLSERLTVESELDEEALFALVSERARVFSRDIKVER